MTKSTLFLLFLSGIYLQSIAQLVATLELKAMKDGLAKLNEQVIEATED